MEARRLADELQVVVAERRASGRDDDPGDDGLGRVLAEPKREQRGEAAAALGEELGEPSASTRRLPLADRSRAEGRHGVDDELQLGVDGVYGFAASALGQRSTFANLEGGLGLGVVGGVDKHEAAGTVGIDEVVGQGAGGKDERELVVSGG